MIIYPHSNEPSENFITWIGEETPRIICKLCHVTKMERKGRFYYCPRDNISIPINEAINDIPKTDYSVCRLSIEPALVVIDSKRLDKRALDDSRQQIKSRYYRGKIIEDDVKSIIGYSATIVDDYEH